MAAKKPAKKTKSLKKAKKLKKVLPLGGMTGTVKGDDADLAVTSVT
jgi:hypothetical protein